MAFRIIADSSCDIFNLEQKIDDLYFSTVPFVITVDGKLGLWGVGIASEEGTIKMKKIAKGGKRTLQVIMHDFKERVADKESIVISHCQN